jgi:hypothetical protein
MPPLAPLTSSCVTSLPTLLLAALQHILPSQRLLELPGSIPLLLRHIPEQEVVASLSAAWGLGGASGSNGAAAGSGGEGGSSRGRLSSGGEGGRGSLSVRRWQQLVREVEAQVRAGAWV